MNSQWQMTKVHGFIGGKRKISHNMRSKKVAIIGKYSVQTKPRNSTNTDILGAGPSGLVTAKTLLHNYPNGTFAPVVFDSRHEVGGLWPYHEKVKHNRRSTGEPKTLDPRMRTNLSRFTVAFSDLSWETVMGHPDVPIFPQAYQVGLYLATYAERFIPKDVLRLGCRVVRAVRMVEIDRGARWKIDWIRNRYVS